MGARASKHEGKRVKKEQLEKFHRAVAESVERVWWRHWRARRTQEKALAKKKR